MSYYLGLITVSYVSGAFLLFACRWKPDAGDGVRTIVFGSIDAINLLVTRLMQSNN